MVDYVLARKTRNITSNLVHIFLNILLGVGAVLVTVLSGSPLLGILLVIMSKWRVFAVRARYFWVNFKSNLIDFIVGISVVLISFYSGTAFLPVHFILMVFYCVWLIIIKPLSSDVATMVQSLIGVFFGITASVMLSAALNPVLIVLLAFLVGYAASRHILAQSSDKDFTLTTLVCGLIYGEIAWLMHTWSIIYTFGQTGIKIPQMAIVLTIFTFVYNYTRRMMIQYQDDFRLKQVAGPLIFGVVMIGIIVIFFSNPIFNI